MKFCKHHVMDRCRKNGRPCTFSKECFEAEEVHKTNADRIRAMSDEELGKFLYGYFWGRLPVLPNREEKLLDWLQQPAEEGD